MRGEKVSVVMMSKAMKTAAWGGAIVGATLAARAAMRARRYMDFAGKVVLITGGSRGLGLVLARQLAEEGARLALCARDELELTNARDELIARGADVLTVQCDVTVQSQVEALIRGVVGHFGTLDVLINNAGIISVGPLEVQTLEDYELAMRVHFYAPLFTTLAALPVLRARPEGARIVNIASIGGKLAVPHLLPYSASKFALVGFSEGLRAELKKDRVLVTTVCPSLMRTGSTQQALFKGQYRKEYAWFTLFDSIPGQSMSAKRAARKILDAARHGDAELLLGWPAKLATMVHGMVPGLTTDLLALGNGFLPSAEGGTVERIPGAQSQSPRTPQWAQSMTERMAVENNENLP
jgi:NAD(P)-dependent dehydrogenase (short-subunit alcohol dehydrogenase family)